MLQSNFIALVNGNEIEPYMFKKIEVSMRSFYCELKHRPPSDRTGELEELIETLILEVPRLKNSSFEKQWAIAQLWNKLHSSEFVARGINQVFMFNSKAEELIIRLEVNPFEDEPARKLTAPETKKFENWQRQVTNQFKKLYGISIEQWQQMQIQTEDESEDVEEDWGGNGDYATT